VIDDHDHPRWAPLRAGTALVAIGAGAIGWTATGLIAAVPAGVGLATLAASDLATHRFSLRILGLSSALVIGGLAVDSARAGSWNRMEGAALGVVVLSIVLTIGWLATSGFSLGDVLLVAFAAIVPFYVSTGAAVFTFVATSMAAAVYVVVRALAHGAARSKSVPLGPALLVGWLCGVIFG
jgi:prepilin signal peptidase PulO-like enzyme (type II secretory pathway)